MKTISLLLISACLAITGFTSPNMAPPFKAEVLATVKLYDGTIVEKEIYIPVSLVSRKFDFRKKIEEFNTTDHNTLNWKYVDFVKFEYDDEQYHFISVKYDEIATKRMFTIEKGRFFHLVENGVCRVFANYYQPNAQNHLVRKNHEAVTQTSLVDDPNLPHFEYQDEYPPLYYIQKENNLAILVTGIIINKKQKVADYFGDCPLLSKKIRDGEFLPNEAIFLAQYYNTFCVEKMDE